MQVKVIPLSDFVHGPITAVKDHPQLMEQSLARDLEQHGLVRINLVPRRIDQALVEGAGGVLVNHPAGKAPDGGKGPPSSALPAAPASRRPILRLPKRGAASVPKTGT